MSRARQSLKKRLRTVGLLHGYDALRGSWGPAWERLLERMGRPFVFDPKRAENLPKKLMMNNMYGKFGNAAYLAWEKVSTRDVRISIGKTSIIVDYDILVPWSEQARKPYA